MDGKNGLTVKTDKKSGEEIVQKGDARVRISKCIMCNSKH